MFSLLLRCDAAEKDFLIADLWECGVSGITERDAPLLEAFFEDDALAPSLLDRFAAYAAERAQPDPRDYLREFEESWPPQPVGDRMFLVAPWDHAPAPAGRLRLHYQPGMACGTGAHPATQLCLQALEQCVRHDDTVLDLGAGSGILAAAAALLGARRVIACDIDPAAAAIAAANLRRDNLAAHIYAGSVRSLRDNSIDLVVANLNAVTLKNLLPGIQRIAKPGGTVIASGFRQSEAPAIPGIRATLTDSGWLCHIVTVSKTPSSGDS